MTFMGGIVAGREFVRKAPSRRVPGLGAAAGQPISKARAPALLRKAPAHLATQAAGHHGCRHTPSAFRVLPGSISGMNRSRRSLVNRLIAATAILFAAQALFFYANSAATVRHLAELNAAGPRQAIQEQTGLASHATRGPRGSGGYIQLVTPRTGPIEIACPAGPGATADPCAPAARRDWERDVVTITWVDVRVGLFETLVHQPLRIVAGTHTLFETSLDDALAAEWRGAHRSMWLMPACDVAMAAVLMAMLARRRQQGRPARPASAV
jgi:hypothetical protein